MFWSVSSTESTSYREYHGMLLFRYCRYCLFYCLFKLRTFQLRSKKWLVAKLQTPKPCVLRMLRSIPSFASASMPTAQPLGKCRALERRTATAHDSSKVVELLKSPFLQYSLHLLLTFNYFFTSVHLHQCINHHQISPDIYLLWKNIPSFHLRVVKNRPCHPRYGTMRFTSSTLPSGWIWERIRSTTGEPSTPSRDVPKVRATQLQIGWLPVMWVCLKMLGIFPMK